MGKTYYDSTLTDEQIQQVLDAINNILTPSNNGKVLAISGGTLEARSVQWGGGYPEPTGTITLTENGLHNVKDYAEANVQVQGGGAVVQPLSVTQNGTYNPPSGVDGYAPVTVNVSGGSGDPVLPAEYQEVEYIQYYDYQYILIGQNIRSEIFSIDVSQDAISSEDSAFAGYYSNSASPELYFLNGSIMFFARNPSVNVTLLSGIASGERVNITVTIFEADSDFKIGSYRNGRYPFQGKIYRAEITQQNNGDRILLKPCYRKVDDVIGFYDVIGGTFYTNQGTGSFGKGPDVN